MIEPEICFADLNDDMALAVNISSSLKRKETEFILAVRKIMFAFALNMLWIIVQMI